MKEKKARKKADRLDPHVAYFAAIRVIAHATTGKYGSTVVPELTAMDAVKRYEHDHDLFGRTSR